MKKLTIFVIALIALLASACQPDPEVIAAAVEAAMPEPVAVEPAPAPPTAEEIAKAMKALEAEEAAEEAVVAAPVSDWCETPWKVREVDAPDGIASIYDVDANGNIRLIDSQRALTYRQAGKDGDVFWGFVSDGTEVCVSAAYGDFLRLEGYRLTDEVFATKGQAGSKVPEWREQVTMFGDNLEIREIDYYIYVLASDLEVGIGGDVFQEGFCDPAYPTVCIPISATDLSCVDVAARNFEVGSNDPHGFDKDGNGIGCETE